MRIYVAGHSQDECKKVANLLVDAGHEITSSWLKEDFKRTAEYTDQEKRLIANKDIQEVMGSDVLVMLSSPTRVPGGKFVELGVAIGAGKKVCLIGHRENMLMWSSLVSQHNSAEDLCKSLNQQGS